MKVSSICFALLVIVQLWNGAKAAKPHAKLQVSKALTPEDKNQQDAAKLSPLQVMMSPKTALKAVSAAMLLYGVSGLFAPIISWLAFRSRTR